VIEAPEPVSADDWDAYEREMHAGRRDGATDVFRDDRGRASSPEEGTSGPRGDRSDPPVKRVRDLVEIALAAVRLAATHPNPHNRVQTLGAPKNHVIRMAVSGLLDIFEEATGIAPTVYSSEHSKDGYAGNFYQFAVACLAPARIVPRKQLGSAILAAYREERGGGRSPK
jgi:hypothetical protein